MSVNNDHLLSGGWDRSDPRLVEVLDEVPLWSAPFGLKLLEGIEYRKAMRVLDIGPGTGFPLTELAMRLGKKATIHGIDPWGAAVDRAEKKLGVYGITNVKIIRGSAESIPLEDHSIDLIVSNNGLNNVPDQAKALSECARILKNDGQFIQTMNLEGTMTEFYSVMEKVLKDRGMDHCVALMHEHIHQKRKPLDQYLEALVSHGFIIHAVTHESFDYRFVDGTTMLEHFFIRLAFLDSWKGIVPAGMAEGVFKQIESELNNISGEEGFLRLSIPFVLIDCRKQ